MQDVFTNIGGKRNAGQIRLDITNFGNLLNHDWGVSQRVVVVDDRRQRRADPDQRRRRRSRDARAYRMAVVNNELVKTTFQTNTALGDVYQFLLSFRYSFN